MYRIKLLNNTLPTQKSETLLHEILEYLNAVLELGLEHRVIQSLGFELYQVLHDNKLRF